jgi:hypothetical protein
MRSGGFGVAVSVGLSPGGYDERMIRSLIGLPLQLGIRGARVALDGAAGVAERTLGIAAALADALTKDSADLDFDGSEHEAARPRPAT